MTNPPPLQGKTALITGGSRGIGLGAAKALAAAGAQVVIVARSETSLAGADDVLQAAGFSATLIPLDLKQLDQVDRLGPTLYERFGGLDVFIGNAAMLGVLSPLEHYSAELFDQVITVNLTANFRLLRTLHPLLKRSEAGRVVFLTSGVTRFHPSYWGPYTASKAGIEALARTYAHEVSNTPIRVAILDPGVMRTRMRAQAFPGEDPASLPDPDKIGPAILPLCLPSYQGMADLVQA